MNRRQQRARQETRNFHNDHRVRAGKAKKRRERYVTINPNEKKVTIEVQGLVSKVPFQWKRCDTCRGDGTVTNPAIDAGGISEQEMHRKGPRFREQYFSGAYDQECPECKGRRVVPDLKPSNEAQEEVVRALHETLQEATDTDAARRAERARGA
jgi:DnaJ-class molecular chaperone